MFRLPHVYTLSVFDSAPRTVVCPWEEACRSSKQSCSQHLKIPEERDQPASAGGLWTQRRRGEMCTTVEVYSAFNYMEIVIVSLLDISLLTWCVLTMCIDSHKWVLEQNKEKVIFCIC